MNKFPIGQFRHTILPIFYTQLAGQCLTLNWCSLTGRRSASTLEMLMLWSQRHAHTFHMISLCTISIGYLVFWKPIPWGCILNFVSTSRERIRRGKLPAYQIREQWEADSTTSPQETQFLWKQQMTTTLLIGSLSRKILFHQIQG